MAFLEIRLFGHPQVSLNGELVSELRSEKALALLAYLVVESDRAHRRERLAGLLWPDFTEASARMNLSRALADLRAAISQTDSEVFFHTTRQTIEFNTESDSWVDVRSFNQLLSSKSPVDQDISSADDRLEEAVKLCRAPFLEGFSLRGSAGFEEWILLTRERLGRQAREALMYLADEYERQGKHQQALDHVWRLLELDPWQENAHRKLMRLLALDGRRDAALAQYEEYRQELARELGTEPSAQTRELYDSLRSGGWPIAAEAMPARTTVAQEIRGLCPYRGLESFREQDYPYYFGRESFTINLKEAVSSSPFTAVIGPSGSGKSSVIFAGLVPQLKTDTEAGWLIAQCRLGRDPVRSLESTMSSLFPTDKDEEGHAGQRFKLDDHLTQAAADILEHHQKKKRILLIIDQFEELYVRCQDLERRQRFLDLIATVGDDALSQLVILITLRADFMAQALAYRPFADILQQGSMLLGPMSPNELLAAIVKPAEKQGVAFEPGLANRILDDVGDEPGNLPSLEFALTLLWERESDVWLRHDSYDQLGGVGEALGRYAEQVFAGLSDEDQYKISQIMMQMVNPGEGTEDTRRVATQEEIGEANWALTGYLADRRLVVTGIDIDGKETVELAHEVIIQEWGRLQGWLMANRSFRVWQEGLRTFLHLWETGGEDESALLRGIQLEKAEEWLAAREDELGDSEKEYIRRGVNLRERREAEKKAQQKQQSAVERRARRLTILSAGAIMVAILATIFLVYYYPKQRREVQEAQSLSLARYSQRALLENDTSLGLLLAWAANQINDPPEEAQRVLLEAAYAPGARQRIFAWTLSGKIRTFGTALDVSPDGRSAVTGFVDGSILQWDLETKKELVRIEGPQQIEDIAISPNGMKVLSAGNFGHVILWNLLTGEQIWNSRVNSRKVHSVDISVDGKMGASGSGGLNGGELIIQEMESGREVQRYESSAGIAAARFTPDSHKLLMASGNPDLCLKGFSVNTDTEPNVLMLWEVDSWELVWTSEPVDDIIVSLDISPDGVRALTGSCDGSVLLWDLNTGRRLASFEGHREVVSAVEFTPSGREAVSGSWDNTLVLWDLKAKEALVRYDVHDEDVLDVAISPDGHSMLSLSEEGEFIFSDLLDASVIRRFKGHENTVYDIAIFPDEIHALSVSGGAKGASSANSSISLWNLMTGEQIRSAEIALNTIFQVAISPDGNTALLAGTDSAIRVWDIAKWEEVDRLEVGHTNSVTGIIFHPEGDRVLSVSDDDMLFYWDLSTGEYIYRKVVKGSAVALSPAGQTIVSGTRSDDISFALIDLDDGNFLEFYKGPWSFEKQGSRALAFLPDGESVLSCERDGTLIEWDVESGSQVRRLGILDKPCSRVVVSGGGDFAVTASEDEGLLILWNLENGESVRSFNTQGTIHDITLAPDGESVYFGSSDGSIYQWRTDYPSLEELKAWVASNRFVPDLTCEERAKYQVKPLCK